MMGAVGRRITPVADMLLVAVGQGDITPRPQRSPTSFPLTDRSRSPCNAERVSQHSMFPEARAH